MNTLKIKSSQWEVLQEKIRRKYNTLSDADLEYQEGEEDILIERLAKRIRRTTDYVRFTLSKELLDLNSNRL